MLILSLRTYSEASFTLSGHTGLWYIKADSGPDSNACNAGSQTLYTYSAFNLTHNTQYIYTAYSDSACTTANKLDDVTFTTLAKKLVADKIEQNEARLTRVGLRNDSMVKTYIKGDAAPHNTCTKFDDIAIVTRGRIEDFTLLTGLDPGASYTYRGYEDSACATEVTSVTFTTLPAELTAINLGLDTVTLRLTGHKGRDWYYQANKAPHDTCTEQKGNAPNPTNTLHVSGLTKATEYTYTAYTDSACTVGNELDDDGVTFTTLEKTPTLTVSYVSPTTAQLDIEGYTGAWWYKSESGDSGSICQYVPSGSVAYPTHLTPGVTYTFKAYTNCVSEIAATSAVATPVLAECSNLSILNARAGHSTANQDWIPYVEVKNNSGEVIHNVRTLTYFSGGSASPLTRSYMYYGQNPGGGIISEIEPGATAIRSSKHSSGRRLGELNGVVQIVDTDTKTVSCESVVEPSWWVPPRLGLSYKEPARPSSWVSMRLDNPTPGAGETATIAVTAYATTYTQLLQACVNLSFDGLTPVDDNLDGNHDVVMYDGPNGRFNEDGTTNANGHYRSSRLEYDADGYDDDRDNIRYLPQCSDAAGKFAGSLFRIGNTENRTSTAVKWPTGGGHLTYTVKVPVTRNSSGSGCLIATVRALPAEPFERLADNTAKICLGPPPSDDPEMPVLFQEGRADLVTLHKCADGKSFPCAGKSTDDLVQYVRAGSDDFEGAPGPVDSENLANVGSGNAAENAGSPYRAFRPGDVVTHVPDSTTIGGRRVRVNAEPNNVPSGTYPANRPAWYTAHDLADRPSDSNDFGHLATLGNYLKGVAVKYRFLGADYNRYYLSMCAKHDPNYLTDLTDTTPCATATDTNPGLMRGLWWKSWTFELLDMAETPQPTSDFNRPQLYPGNIVFEFSTLGTHVADIIIEGRPTGGTRRTLGRHTFHVGPAADLSVHPGGASASVVSGQRVFTIVAESERTAELDGETYIDGHGDEHEIYVYLEALQPVVQVTSGGKAIPAAAVSQVWPSRGGYDTATGKWTLPDGFKGQATLTLAVGKNVGSVKAEIANNADVCETAAGAAVTTVDGRAAVDRLTCEFNSDGATSSGNHWGSYQWCVFPNASKQRGDALSSENACTAWTTPTGGTWHTTEVYDWNQNNNSETWTPDDAGFTLNARGAGENTVKLTWSKQRDADDYVIYTALTNRIDGLTYLAGVSGDTTEYYHRGLDKGDTRYYLVFARKDGRPYKMSGMVSGTAQMPTNTSYIRVPDLVIPLGPGSVRATAVWPQGARLSWSGPSTLFNAAVEYYEIEASDDGVYWTTLVPMTTATSYADTTLAAGESRYYRIYAHNKEGHSMRSTAARGTGAGLIARAEGMGRIRLIWIGAGAEESYDVERSEDGVTWEEIAAGVSGSGYTDDGLSSGETWFYRVYPYRGGVRGSVSAVVSATTINAVGGASGLSASVSESGAVTLTWTPGDGANAHIVAGLRASEDGAESGSRTVYGYADELDKHTIPAEDMTGGVWTFYVLALYRSDDGTEDLTEDTPMPSFKVVMGYPGPTELTATPGGGPDRIALEWEPPGDFYGLPVEYYEVESSTDGATWTQLTTDLPVPEYTDTGLALGDKRYYRVFAHNAGGRTLPSESARATTIQLGPASGVAAVLNGDGSVTVSWTAGSDANLYVMAVERKNEDGSYDSATPSYVTVTSKLSHTMNAAHVDGLPPGTYAFTVLAGHETRYGTRAWTDEASKPYAEMDVG